jgi:hypothetical protein
MQGDIDLAEHTIALAGRIHAKLAEQGYYLVDDVDLEGYDEALLGPMIEDLANEEGAELSAVGGMALLRDWLARQLDST